MKTLLCLFAVCLMPIAHAQDVLRVPGVAADGLFMTDDPNAQFGAALPPNANGVWETVTIGGVAHAFELSAFFPNGLTLGQTATSWTYGAPGSPDEAGPPFSLYAAGVVTLNPREVANPLAPSNHAADMSPVGLAGGVGGIGRFKDGPLASMDNGPELLAVRWSEVADYDAGAVPPACAANGEHQVYLWASEFDAPWQAAHPDAWPMLVVTWHQMVPRGCEGLPNTFQMIIAQRPEVGATGRNLALVEYRYETCNWSAPIMGPDVVGGRSGVLVRGPAVQQAVEIFGAQGQLEDHIDGIPNPESEGFSGDPSMPMAYCARSNVHDANDASVPGVFVFQFGANGLIETEGAAGDPDLDGIPSALDNCPRNFNPRQNNLGGGGEGDACDPDQDGDQRLNGRDNCPRVWNFDQEDNDGDHRGDACDRDLDGDKWANLLGDEETSPFLLDNCPELANHDQYDFDGNGKGDVCEEDGLTFERMIELTIQAKPALDLLTGEEPSSGEMKQLTDELFMQSSIERDAIQAVIVEVIEAWQQSKMKYLSEYLKWHEEERLYRLKKSK